MNARVAVLAPADDLHALAVRARLAERGIGCAVVEIDALAGHPAGLTWSTEPVSYPSRIPVRDGGALDLAACELVWFRRINLPQGGLPPDADPAHVDVVDASCAAALFGALRNGFAGRWVSDPDATIAAENKLVQLRAAAAADLTVPPTLVSQDPAAIRSFCARHGRTVLKTVRATRRRPLYTLDVTPEHLAADAALRLCPTIFQAYVPGTRHVRALCCGDQVHAVVMEAAELDWRGDLDRPCVPYAVDDVTAKAIARLLDLLGLRMGVVDLKLTPDGETVFLELNPQGQFLFAEGMSGLDLTGAFCDFLAAELVAG